MASILEKKEIKESEENIYKLADRIPEFDDTLFSDIEEFLKAPEYFDYEGRRYYPAKSLTSHNSNGELNYYTTKGDDLYFYYTTDKFYYSYPDSDGRIVTNKNMY